MVKHYNQISVQLDDDRALIRAAGNTYHVAQKDRTDARAGCPMHLMLGALGACIMLTLKAVADHKGICLGSPDIHIDYYRNDHGDTRFQVVLKLDDHLSERERKILYQSARVCEVGKILKSDVHIDYRLADNAGKPFTAPQNRNQLDQRPDYCVPEMESTTKGMERLP
ncbi:MAG: OsmC family protein [Desulfobacteraceae bacterium]|jgi:uncharacterized OsmC-like protein